MSKSVFNCDFCHYEYNNKNKRPMSLPCGHVFCEECLLKLKIEDNENNNIMTCPKDNRAFNIDQKKIPICYQILSNLPINTNYLNCARHSDKRIKYLCLNHLTFPCSVCVNEHKGPGHELEIFDLDLDKITGEFKKVVSIVEKEISQTREYYEKFNRFEKISRDYFFHQLNKLDRNFEKMNKFLNEKKKIFEDEIKASNEDIKNKFEAEKQKAQIKFEQVTKLKNVFIQNYSKSDSNYELFFKIKEDLLNEIKKLPEIHSIFTENFPFAYYSNSFKIEDVGLIKYYKSFQDLEQKYIDKKANKKISNTKNFHEKINDNEEEKDLSNIFQHNLLNDQNDSNSPSKKLNSKSSDKLLNSNWQINHNSNLEFQIKNNHPENYYEDNQLLKINSCEVDYGLKKINKQISYKNENKKKTIYPFSLRDNNTSHLQNSSLIFASKKNTPNMMIENQSKQIHQTLVSNPQIIKNSNKSEEKNEFGQSPNNKNYSKMVFQGKPESSTLNSELEFKYEKKASSNKGKNEILGSNNYSNKNLKEVRNNVNNTQHSDLSDENCEKENKKSGKIKTRNVSSTKVMCKVKTKVNPNNKINKSNINVRSSSNSKKIQNVENIGNQKNQQHVKKKQKVKHKQKVLNINNLSF